MSTKFAAWLHVTPSPKTLAESSAVYQALSKHGRLSAFIRSKHAKDGLKTESNGSSTFYTVFPHEPSTLQKTFNVSVYHNLPTARDEDPFNIRGLQNRKPMPVPKTFTCVLEVASRREVKSQEEAMTEQNPYHGQFEVKKQGWLESVLVDTNAPPGVPKGCATTILDDDSKMMPVNDPDGVNRPGGRPQRKINMRSLMEMWQEAIGLNKSEKGSSKDNGRAFKGVPGTRMILNADRSSRMSYTTDGQSTQEDWQHKDKAHGKSN